LYPKTGIPNQSTHFPPQPATLPAKRYVTLLLLCYKANSSSHSLRVENENENNLKKTKLPSPLLPLLKSGLGRPLDDLTSKSNILPQKTSEAQNANEVLVKVAELETPLVRKILAISRTITSIQLLVG
jgi:hypothetical protein